MASVIVAGATGAIGRTVIQHAIRQPSIQRVVALTRAANVTEANYEQLFGVVTRLKAAENGNETRSGNFADHVMVTPQEAAKIQPITMDWEAFTTYWTTANAATPAAPVAAADPYNKYKEIFSGHTYAAMCLGTTRKDAGSAKQFIRCDYDYVIAFTEAVLKFSAPAGMGPETAFTRRIADGGAKRKDAVAAQAQAAAPPSPVPISADTTGTLRTFCQISASGSRSDSWFLYMRTKGSADEATVERIHHHNRQAAATAGDVEPIVLFLLRPGLLDRHGKSRMGESIARLFISSIPVETCGAAVVSAFVEPKIRQAILASASQPGATPAKGQGKTCKGESTALLGSPFEATEAMKRAGVQSAEQCVYAYELSNANIKRLAARLSESKPAAEAP